MQFQRKIMLPSIMLVATVLLTASFASAVFMHKMVVAVYAQDSNSGTGFGNTTNFHFQMVKVFP
jgi:hypothetical protein